MRISTQTLFQQQVLNMLDQQRSINDLQLQMTTGRRYIRPSDNPIESSKINRLTDYLATLDKFEANINTARSRLDFVETTTNNLISNMQRVSELTTQALNGTLSDNDRASVALEIETLLEGLVRLANSTDETGEYLFSGFKTQVKPYVRQGDQYIYQGDQGVKQLNIGPNTDLAVTQSGFQLFEAVKNGNGTFQTNTGPSVNTGTGVISAGEVTSQANYVPDNYTIRFVTNGSGQLAYQVVGATSGQVIPAPPAVTPNDAPLFIEGDQIEFNGVSVEITGQPAVGDDFEVKPSTNEKCILGVRPDGVAATTNDVK